MKLALSLAAAISALTVQSASAHGIWTEQRYGHLEVVYGHGAEDEGYAPDKIKGVWAYDQKGGAVPVTVKRLDDHARLQPSAAPAVVTVAFDNGIWSQDTAGTYVNAPMAEVPGAVSSSHSYKYSLAILKPHAHVPERLKLAMLIRPLKDPTEVGVGNLLPVEVIIDGKPAADVALFDDYRGLPDAQSVKTDARGRANVVVRNAGLNIIAAQADVPVTGAAVSQRNLFTSLSFVGQAHQH
ncbi:DUF4198 domain-containing protein [Pseudomonas sp. MAFF212428]|uniref:DUF4198 domain-containing protein n=1 Tax=Pseudomonas brassicae TaxID=2708063 RepID=A0A6B3NND9_9PSED|nr:DUF4198 domain-containing protein [Pseudomonas brassicae]NER59575.1 DUF4198 domain-containing protein [Pseudomonas brassicae]NER63356.1 DUF4198 domain-containing protein [Pseudomonas brassicae]